MVIGDRTMTLHEAMIEVLSDCPDQLATFEYISSEIARRGSYIRADGSPPPASQIRARSRQYQDVFEVVLPGKVRLRSDYNKVKLPSQPVSKAGAGRYADSDEGYILGLCDRVLGRASLRQHRFDFLRGDVGKDGRRGAMLPVDAYYSDSDLVIEYRERQHTESVPFFDKPERLTVSGVHRGEQRNVYDQRRRTILPQHGIELIEFSYSDFRHDPKKRLLRDEANDIQVIRQRLSRWI